ncbi:hypothetical protein BU25DRAFT_416390 [Macroventuria anomochaeta]|uniref:Uncharacterized protein n=1 Tax=Macroventuria anomochaeta TaxID=301207 RepID=A0ACB6RJ19_9PLEO|nr:uncharacterized protein BU25DRAFT_416390 [Macroventuria anomochaeta]KAF2621098.1 hypothetical protein BU25DRAFT_416390 [Macroventuria anomochaeta]
MSTVSRYLDTEWVCVCGVALLSQAGRRRLAVVPGLGRTIYRSVPRFRLSQLLVFYIVLVRPILSLSICSGYRTRACSSNI